MIILNDNSRETLCTVLSVSDIVQRQCINASVWYFDFVLLSGAFIADIKFIIVYVSISTNK